MADIIKLLISGLVLGLVVFIARKGVTYFEGMVGGVIPEELQSYRIPMLVFALILIMFGRKIHRLVPEAGMVLLAVYFADLLEGFKTGLSERSKGG